MTNADYVFERQASRTKDQGLPVEDSKHEMGAEVIIFNFHCDFILYKNKVIRLIGFVRIFFSTKVWFWRIRFLLHRILSTKLVKK
jgi:hypothetical protein